MHEIIQIAYGQLPIQFHVLLIKLLVHEQADKSCVVLTKGSLRIKVKWAKLH